MRPLSAVFVVVSLSLAAVRAQDKGAAPAPQGAETYEAVNKEYTDAVRAWGKEYRAARASLPIRLEAAYNDRREALNQGE